MCFNLFVIGLALNCFTGRATKPPNGWKRKSPNWTRKNWVEICKRFKPCSDGIKTWNVNWLRWRKESTELITCRHRKFIFPLTNWCWCIFNEVVIIWITSIKGHGLLPGRKASRSNASKGSPGTLGTSQGKIRYLFSTFLMMCSRSIKLNFDWLFLIRAKPSTGDLVWNRPLANNFSSKKPKVWLVRLIFFSKLFSVLYIKMLSHRVSFFF